METINRHLAPINIPINTVSLKELSVFNLASGALVYYIPTKDTGVLKMDIILDGGLKNQRVSGIASAVSTLLTEGTKNYTGAQIAEGLDKYGAYIQTRTTFDDAVITLYCLPRYLKHCSSFIVSILSECDFPEKEVNNYKTKALQRLSINSQRNSFVGRRAFYSSVFGNDNYYGRAVYQDDYEIISRETLIPFYQTKIQSQVKYILLSGDVNEQTLQEIRFIFNDFKCSSPNNSISTIVDQSQQNLFIENAFSVQSSIQIGRRLVSRKHPQYHKLQLLNLGLGGYFGSRLMKNIREEKGLTYGIYSAIESYLEEGVFYIETEINNDLRNIAYKEILLEMGKMRDTQIPKEELTLIKNYMLGSFLRGVDGPFSLIDRYKTIIDFGFTHEYYQLFVDTIKSTTAVELHDLANTYFGEADLTSVIVGNK